MNNHFIKNVELVNFKCFKELNVNNLKRVNLIGGKNNIGKTSFLEAIEMLSKPKSAFGLRIMVSDVIRRRQLKRNMLFPQSQQFQEFEMDFFDEEKKEIILKNNFFNLKLKYINTGERIESNNIQLFSSSMMQPFNQEFKKSAPTPFLEFTFNNDKLASSVQDFLNTLVQDKNHTKNNVNFISSTTTDEMSLATYYGSLITSNQEEYLNESLKLFDSNILALKVIPTQGGTILKLKLENRQQLTLLSSLGEGINRYIAILCAIWASKDGYLFIDEIENGIHYTNYKKLWKIIFEASKMANCQIFTTTHSKECIEIFNEINKDNEGIYLEFYKNQKNGLISVKERDNEQLDYALTHNREVRGE